MLEGIGAVAGTLGRQRRFVDVFRLQAEVILDIRILFADGFIGSVEDQSLYGAADSLGQFFVFQPEADGIGLNAQCLVDELLGHSLFCGSFLCRSFCRFGILCCRLFSLAGAGRSAASAKHGYCKDSCQKKCKFLFHSSFLHFSLNCVKQVTYYHISVLKESCFLTICLPPDIRPRKQTGGRSFASSPNLNYSPIYGEDG